jgi:isopentenyldiphosphate isomerase
MHTPRRKRTHATGKGDVLLQRRSDDKALEAGCWDLSCAEHLSTGETYLQGAIRGLREELGIEAAAEQLQRLRPAYYHMESYPDKVSSTCTAGRERVCAVTV